MDKTRKRIVGGIGATLGSIGICLALLPPNNGMVITPVLALGVAVGVCVFAARWISAKH